MKKRRSEFEILIEALQVASSKSDGITKTELVYLTNSTFPRANNFLKFLIDRGLLQRLEDNDGSRYRITNEGKELVVAFQPIQQKLLKLKQ
ncbi:MAG: winged helix-turn-helix domain-containing protein [Nitrososphaerales archaeon]